MPKGQVHRPVEMGKSITLVLSSRVLRTGTGFRTATLTDPPHILCGKSLSVKVWAVVDLMQLSPAAR